MLFFGQNFPKVAKNDIFSGFCDRFLKKNMFFIVFWERLENHISRQKKFDKHFEKNLSPRENGRSIPGGS